MITVWDKEKNLQFENIPAKEGFVNWKKDGRNYQRYYYFYDEKELKNLLEKIGFKVTKIAHEAESASKLSRKNLVFYVEK